MPVNTSKIRRNGESRSPSDQRIIVMRHGERRDGAIGAAAEVDPPLTENAVGHVAAVAERLRSVMDPPKVENLLLLVSPFQRTLETARLLQQNGVGSAKEFIVDKTLCEVFGPLRVKSSTPPLLCAAVLKSGTGSLPEWGESMESAALRYAHSFYSNSERYHDHNLLFVTHGDAIGSILGSLYPMRTVYEADYLSFLMFKKSPQKLADAGHASYELVDFDGVQWFLEGPEVFGGKPCVQETEQSSREGTCMREEVSSNAVRPLGAPHFSVLACGDELSREGTEKIMAGGGEIDGEYVIQGETSHTSIVVLRIGAVFSQMLTFLSWPCASDAAIYVFAVAAIEAPCLLTNIPKCLTAYANFFAHVKKIEMLDFSSVVSCIIKLLAFNGERPARFSYSILKHFAATSVKTFAVFTLSCVVAIVLSTLSHGSFHMIHSYASFFTGLGNFCVFALFLIFNIMRGFHEEIGSEMYENHTAFVHREDLYTVEGNETKRTALQ